jgi:hypothetical protein
MNALLPFLRDVTQPAPVIATDVAQLLAASSFVTPTAEAHADPRASRAFDIVATAFCGGAKLLVPLPKDRFENIPLFDRLWRSEAAVEAKPNLELTDTGFAAVAAAASPGLAQYVEGVPDDAARWIAFQFTGAVVTNHLSRSDLEPIRRAAQTATHLLESKRLQRFEDAILRLHRTEGLREPREYEELTPTTEIPSLIHLCTAYLVSVALRGFSYAGALDSTVGSPVYHHHWVRGPVLRAAIGDDYSRTLEEKTHVWFPWGAILRRVFDPADPWISRDETAVIDVLSAIRSQATAFSMDLASIARASIAESSDTDVRLTEAEGLVVDVLSRAGVALKYSTKVRTRRLAKVLRDIVEDSLPFAKVPVEIVLAGLQPGWARKADGKYRVRFRRNTFWDVFEDAGIRATTGRALTSLRASERREEEHEHP